MEANGFNELESNPFVLTKVTAEVIPAAFHPNGIKRSPAALVRGPGGIQICFLKNFFIVFLDRVGHREFNLIKIIKYNR